MFPCFLSVEICLRKDASLLCLGGVNDVVVVGIDLGGCGWIGEICFF